MSADGSRPAQDFVADALAARDRSARAWALRILRVLAGHANADLLGSLLRATGHRMAHHEVLGCAEWLEARHYITIDHFDGVPVYALTRLGDDAGCGLVADDGLAAIRLSDTEEDDRRRAALTSPSTQTAS